MPATFPTTEVDPEFGEAGATDAELAAAVATVNTALAAKQASATAATDAELATAVSDLTTLLDTEEAARIAADALKQDASTAATDAEVAAAVAAHAAGDATDAELADAVSTLNAALALKQDAATAATDAELAAGLAGKQDAGTAATDAEVTAAIEALRVEIEDDFAQRYDRDNGHAGMVVPYASFLGPPANAACVVGRTHLLRFVPSRDMSIVAMAFCVVVAAGTGDSSVDVGIYDGALARLGSSGFSAAGWNSTGVKSRNLSAPVDLEAEETYYAAMSMPAAFAGTAPSLAGINPSGNVGQLFGTAVGIAENLGVVDSGGLDLSYAGLSNPVTWIMPFLALKEA